LRKEEAYNGDNTVWSHGQLERATVVEVRSGKKIAGGVQTHQPCLTVMVEKKLPLSQLKKKDVVPMVVEGTPTDVVETGNFKVLQSRTDTWRPRSGRRDCAAGFL